MKTIETVATNWNELTHQLGQKFADRAAAYDTDASFVTENYADLKAHNYFSALVPESLGGAGISYDQMCEIIRILGNYCGSTALAFSMHQHLVAATVWKFIHKGEGEPLLRKLVAEQPILVSTGARDWLSSNGEMQKVAGGYLFSARKSFASQSAEGTIAVTSAPYTDEAGNELVLHFAVPFNKGGVSVVNDWDVMGMRATGSCTIVFDQVFVPDNAIVLSRPRHAFHGVWNLVIGVAMPLIMSAYVGIAEQAEQTALAIGSKYQRNSTHLPYIVGKMHNSLIAARVQWKAMVALTNNFDFMPAEEITMEMLSLKTNVSNEGKQVLNLAMDAVGGQGFYKKFSLERMFRDIQASNFHPLPQWEQYAFTGTRLVASQS